MGCGGSKNTVVQRIPRRPLPYVGPADTPMASLSVKQNEPLDTEVETEQQAREQQDLELETSLSKAIMLDTSRIHDAQITRKRPAVPENWRRGELIGEGAYGKIYEWLNLDTGEILATKQVKLDISSPTIEQEVQQLINEIEIFKQLDHKNIVQCISTELNENKTEVDIIMEFMPSGSIRTLLNKFGSFQEKLVKKYTKQILEGLEYLHSNGIIHRDIKGANILVDRDGSVKLTDFGAAKHLGSALINDSYLMSKSLRGSPYWMAPEIAKRTGHTFSADIWSVGCVIIEMMTGIPPWSEKSRDVKRVLELIRTTEVPPEFPANASATCLSFLKSCWVINPEERKSLKELFQHPFIADQTLTEEEERALAAEIAMNPAPRPELSYRESDNYELNAGTLRGFEAFSRGIIDEASSAAEGYSTLKSAAFTDTWQTNNLYNIHEIPITEAKHVPDTIAELRVASSMESLSVSDTSSDSEYESPRLRHEDRIAETKRARRERLLDKKRRKHDRKVKKERNKQFELELKTASDIINV